MVKCIVWDLDNTVWDGTLDANDNVELNLDIKKYIEDASEKVIKKAGFKYKKKGEYSSLDGKRHFESNEYYLEI